MVSVKLPAIGFNAIPKGPKNAVGLSRTRITTIRPFFTKAFAKNKNILDSTLTKDIKNSLRRKGVRGIEPYQLSVQIVVICPKCKEIGNPVAEYVPKYINVRDNPSPKDDKELALFYNHPKGSKHERCRICLIKNGMFAPFKNSKFDFRDLMKGHVVSHIQKKDPGYEKYAQIFDVRA